MGKMLFAVAAYAMVSAVPAVAACGGGQVIVYSFNAGISAAQVETNCATNCNTYAYENCNACDKSPSAIAWTHLFSTYKKFNDVNSGWYGSGTCNFACENP